MAGVASRIVRGCPSSQCSISCSKSRKGEGDGLLPTFCQMLLRHLVHPAPRRLTIYYMRSVLFLLFLLPVSGAFSQVDDSSIRHVPLQGAINFRDLGGYATTDGH